MNPQVQKLLKKVTRFDVDKVFKVRLRNVENPEYKLLTREEVSEVSYRHGINFKYEIWLQLYNICKVQPEGMTG